MKQKIFCKKIQEKCERCGEEAFDTVAYFNEFHSLCAACLDAHNFTDASESESFVPIDFDNI